LRYFPLPYTSPFKSGINADGFMQISKLGRQLFYLFTLLATAAILGACSTPSIGPSPEAPTAAVRASLAPSGRLRAAINFGNPILATRDPASGEARGVSVDLAHELGARLGVPVELVLYAAAGKVVDALATQAWDVGFFAIDPVRAADIDFTPAYVVIEGSYLVPNDSAITRNAEVDREGVHVVVGRGSAYDLYLTRELRHAKLVRAATSPAVSDRMVVDKMEVAAGVKQQLEADAKRIPGVHVLDGRFMVIHQAMAMPRGRDAGGSAYLSQFVQEMKASGFIARALQRHGVEGAAVAPL
jgi:polar amino acid transport system substrate-binding protein